MWHQSNLAKRLGTTYPLIQGGMAGGITTPELVAAVCNAGGLGTLGAGYMSASQICTAIQEIRSRTDGPFAVNLFAPEHPVVTAAQSEEANRVLNHYRQQLGLSEPGINQYAQPFTEQVQAVLDAHVPVFSFTFGLLPKDVMASFQGAGTTLIGTATTVREAVALEKAGVDMVVAQGAEAGGHRGTFAADFATSMVGTMALIPQIVDHVQIPVVAAGGVADGRGIVAAMALGASGVQLGTAFLTCVESGAHPLHKQAVLESSEESTSVTRAFSGKPARGIRNAFMEEMASHESAFLPYPLQNALTQDIRQAAAKQGKPDFMSLWAGQASGLTRTESVPAMIDRLNAEVRGILQTWCGNLDDKA